MDAQNIQLDISVIICAYTEARWGDLTAAVRSVQTGSRQPREIIVVIDHNSSMFGRAQVEIAGVKVAENRYTKGLSGARNTGVEKATGEVVAFLDDDAIATHRWLERIADAFSPDVMGVGGSSEPLWAAGRPPWFPDEFDWVVGCTFRGMPVERRTVGKLIGCNMSFRRQILNVIGGFRSEMGRVGQRPLAGEETEFCHAASKTWPQMRLVYEPKAAVFHRVPETRANLRYFVSRSYCEGLSKALISRYVGASDALATERTYTTRTLPAGFIRGIGATFSERSMAGLGRAGAIGIGLGVTLAGYVVGSVSDRMAKNVREPRATLGLPEGEGAA